jgi:hypothetical protein
MQKGHHRTVKVLATLFEQKVCDFRQLRALCLDDVSISLARKFMAKLKCLQLIETIAYPRIRAMPINLYRLTAEGYKQLLRKCEYLPEYKQIKSNYREHDLALTDVRIAFQQLKECQYYLSENILKSKLLESSSAAIANIRTVNADAAALLNLKGSLTWTSIEYERTLKSNFRYNERFKKWYANSDLKLAILISESQQIQNKLQEIERDIYPNLKRKILFATYNDLASESSTATLTTTCGILLEFQKDKGKKTHLPSLHPIVA